MNKWLKRSKDNAVAENVEVVDSVEKEKSTPTCSLTKHSKTEKSPSTSTKNRKYNEIFFSVWIYFRIGNDEHRQLCFM